MQDVKFDHAQRSVIKKMIEIEVANCIRIAQRFDGYRGNNAGTVIRHEIEERQKDWSFAEARKKAVNTLKIEKRIRDEQSPG